MSRKSSKFTPYIAAFIHFRGVELHGFRINTSDDIATYLKTAVTTLSAVEAHDTVGEAFTVTVAPVQNNGG